MRRWNLFAQFPYEEDADIRHWMFLIYCNFDKAIRFLVEIYGLHCVVCNDLSPAFKTKSGTSEHYWERHKKRTAQFVLSEVLVKSPDEISEDLE